MSLRADTTQLVAEGLLASLYAGHGVRGDDVPDDGESGPAPLYEAITLPTDNDVECRLLITRWPTEGTLTIAEDSSFTYDGDPDYFEGRLYFDGIANTDDEGYGPGIVRVQLGESEEPTGPTIDTQPQDESVTEPAPAVFNVEATSSGGSLTYQWQVNDGGGWDNVSNGGAYSGATTDTLTIDPTSESLDGHLYRCVVSDDNGSANSSSAELTVAADAAPPQGTVTINAVDVGSSFANVSYSYDDTDADSFEYRLDGGSAQPLDPSPAGIFGLAAETEYEIEVRAVNDEGAGDWSAPEAFTTTAAGSGGDGDLTVTSALARPTSRGLTSKL